MPAFPPAHRPSGRRRAAWRPGRALAAALALTLLLAACGGDGGDGEDPPDEATGTPAAGEEEPPEEPVTIRMGQIAGGYLPYPIMEAIPETVAPNMGTWYEVEWNEFDVSELGRNIASDVVDGTGMASLTAAHVIDQGVDLVITGSFNDEDEPEGHPGVRWLVRSDSGITSPADLAGQTVGTIGDGTFADHVADYYISTEGGIEPGQDYQETNLPFPQMPDALLAGQIATGPFFPPFDGMAMAGGEVEELFSAGEVVPGMVVVVQAFRRDFVEENREAVERFMEDWVAANQWMMDPANRDQAIGINAEFSGIPAEAQQEYILSENDIYRPENGALDVEALQGTWDFFYEQGAFENQIDVQDHIIEELLPPQP